MTDPGEDHAVRSGHELGVLGKGRLDANRVARAFDAPKVASAVIQDGEHRAGGIAYGPLVIVLIRHGETALNAARVVQPEDTPLSERGLAQAERVAERVAGLGAARVLSSDLPRASTTAARIALRTGAPVEHTPLLQERNFGALRGRPYSEVGPTLFAPDFLPPEGESWASFHARVRAAFELVRSAAAGLGQANLVVVSHGLLCASLIRQCARLPEGEPVPTRFGNTSVTLIEAHAPFAVTLLNDVSHLAGTAFDDGSAPSGM